MKASKTSLSIEELTKLWKETKVSLVKANKRIKTLEREFKSLSHFVRSSLGNRTAQESPCNQTRGGRRAVSILSSSLVLRAFEVPLTYLL
jgi:hypothetical protein